MNSSRLYIFKRLISLKEHKPFEINIPKRVVRDKEELKVKKARLVYQSRKRGILESDLLCSTFINEYMNDLSSEQLDVYDRLLDENDWDLFYWCSGQREIPERLKGNELLALMQQHFKNEGKNILKMPNLVNK